MSTPLAYCLADRHERPTELAVVTLQELCEILGSTSRVTTGIQQRVIHLHAGDQHLKSPGHYWIGLDSEAWLSTKEQARMVIESLAYGCLDYAAREFVNKSRS